MKILKIIQLTAILRTSHKLVIRKHRGSKKKWVEGRREGGRVGGGGGAAMQFYLLAMVLPETSGSEMFISLI